MRRTVVLANSSMMFLLRGEERWEVLVPLVKEQGKFNHRSLFGIGIKRG
jgi:hypothetical protein